MTFPIILFSDLTYKIPKASKFLFIHSFIIQLHEIS